MEESSPLRPYGLSPQTSRPSRLSAEGIDLCNKPYSGSKSPSTPQTTTTFSSGGEENSTAYTPINHQPHGEKHHYQHRQGRDRSPENDWINRFWIWEALSLLIATLGLAAIVITLLMHGDRPLPKWPSAITINALIAVFSAIFKAGLMMPVAEGISQLKWLWYQKARPLKHMEDWDAASRGPWGSLLLIFTLKGKDLAVIGAILTVVAMAIDPFTQQIVQFYSCSRMVGGERATVPYSNNYTAGYLGRPTGTPELDSQMQSAMYAGLLDPPVNTSAALSFSCRSGNCTFPSTENGAVFMSLAFQSRCVDISGDIHNSVNVTNSTNGDDDEIFTTITTNASLPDYGIYLTNESAYVMQSGNIYSSDWPSSFLNKIAFLMSPLDDSPPQAFECEFYPTVNTYSANVTNGVLLEQVLDSQRMDVWSVPWGTHTLLLMNRTIRAGQWHECSGADDRSDEHDFPVVWWPTPPGPAPGTTYSMDDLTNKSSTSSAAWNYTKWWPQDCVYSIPYAPTTGLSAALAGFLGNETLFFDAWTQRAQGNLWSVNLWQNGSATLDSVRGAMDGLARSVTARWRQGDGPVSDNVGPAVGAVWESQTCVRVNWPWIALPAALLLLTAVFVLLTVARTGSVAARGGSVWKSSVLAVLFNGMDEKTRLASGPAASLAEMRVAAGTTAVRLRDTGDGFRLVGET